MELRASFPSSDGHGSNRWPLGPLVNPPFESKLHQQTLGEPVNAVDIIIEFDLDYGPNGRLYDELDNYILAVNRGDW